MEIEKYDADGDYQDIKITQNKSRISDLKNTPTLYYFFALRMRSL